MQSMRRHTMRTAFNPADAMASKSSRSKKELNIFIVSIYPKVWGSLLTPNVLRVTLEKPSCLTLHIDAIHLWVHRHLSCYIQTE